MKLLHICAVGFGIKTLLKPQIDYFLKQDFKVESSCSPGKELEELQQQGYIVHPIFIERKIKPFSNLNSIFQLIKLIKKHNYDVVHVHSPIASVLGRIAAKIAGTKYIIYTAHGFYFHEKMSPSQYRFYHTIEKATAAITDLILTQSNEDLTTAIKTGIGDENKVKYLGNGIDINYFQKSHLIPEHQQRLKSEFNIPDNALVIAMTGRITQEKGYGELLEAIAILKPEFPTLYLLIIGGQLNTERDEFQTKLYDLIDKKKLKDCVTFTGLRSDIRELLGLANIFTLPSYREGLPRSILEAMAMELPVVTTDIRGCREAVVNKKTGLIVPVKDIKSLAEALKKLLLNPEMRLNFGAMGRQRVEEKFDENFVFQRLAKAYNNELL